VVVGADCYDEAEKYILIRCVGETSFDAMFEADIDGRRQSALVKGMPAKRTCLERRDFHLEGVGLRYVGVSVCTQC
jgi:hypothetical protein